MTALDSASLSGLSVATYHSMKALRDHYGASFAIAGSIKTPPEDTLHAYADFDPAVRHFEHRGKMNWRGYGAFARHVADRARDCDLVWVSGRSTSPLRAALATGKPVVLNMHSSYKQSRRSDLRWKIYYEAFCRRVDHFAYISPFIRAQAVALCPWIEERSSVSLQYAPLRYTDDNARQMRKKEARKSLGLPEDAFIVGSTGRLGAGKRFDVFLNVAARVAAQAPDALFIVNGDGPMKEELMAQARSLGIAQRVIFTGWVADPQEYCEAWDLCLFHSDHEAACRTILEAMSCGTPVVTSVLHGGTADIVSSPIRGYFHPTHDVGAMAEKILELRQAPGLCRKMAKDAAAYIRREYSAEAHSRLMMSAFERAIDRRRTQGGQRA